ncbi:TIGR02679 family protein [Nocardiopsis quinghaiensis]|uniref:TIGR02679 family protein n=1 Tax=Nocardiopsis quinghaiensis TaxID=464995 RepID=UPI001CC26BE4|nr:TIGR02679 family protein [Nocardiopsis quinghaiensis]
MEVTGPDMPRLRRLLDTPATAWLLERSRRRLREGRPLTGTVTRGGATEEERAALSALLGRRPGRGTTVSVRLEQLDVLLRDSGACPDGLAAAVELLTGPVAPREEEREREERAWARVFAPLERVCAPVPALEAWCAGVRRDGRVRRMVAGPEQAGPLVDAVARVVDALPADGVALSHLAARVLGDAHALDDDRSVATLVLGAARLLGGEAAGEGAAWRRRVWASVGVFRDELSSTVLVLNLPGTAMSATGRALAALAGAGEPAVLTLRQLVRDPRHTLWSDRSVSVCENPVVAAGAADRWGAGCAPLVCLQGGPSAAALTLLRQAVDGGARLRVHTDFDWGGVRIANALTRQVPWEPWRLTAADYRSSLGERARPLTGAAAPTDWDPSLAEAMAAHGVRVEEETVLDGLLADLGPV